MSRIRALAPVGIICYYLFMMNNNYYTQLILTDLLHEQQLRQAYALMSEERRLRCDKMRLDRDRRACICADMAIRRLVGRHLGLAADEVVLSANEKGKPYIKGFDAHISISHSGNVVLCALSPYPIGIDVEKIATPPKRLVDKLWPLINGDEDFYRLWTAAESYGKLTGDGVWWAIDQGIGFEEGRPACNDPTCRFESVPCPDGYVATICVKI